MKERLVGLKTLTGLEGKEIISKGIQPVLTENYGYAKKRSRVQKKLIQIEATPSQKSQGG